MTLDVGGVLTLPPVDRVLADLGLASDPTSMLVAHHAAVAVEDAQLAAAPGAPDALGPAREALFAAFADRAGAVGPAKERLVDALREVARSGAPWSVVAPGARAVVDALVDADLGVAIVSNSDGTVARQLAALGICSTSGDGDPQVATIVDSGVVGVRKPDPAIFDQALRALGSSPGATAHVGDTVAFDVVAARAAGMVPIHYDASRSCHGDHIHLSALDELPELLRGGASDQAPATSP